MATRMPRAIVDLDEFVESNNIMVYGDTGAGKTELVAQLPGKVLIISSENGTIVIRKALARLGLSKTQVAKEMKRFKVWKIRAWDDLEACYKWCAENPGVFDWLAIDSATSLDQRAMRAAMEVAVKRNPEKRDIDLPDRGEHQKMQNAMKRMITDFNELPTDVLWLAQAMRREDQDGNEIVVPFIRGKDYEVSAFACAQMQAFGYYMKKPTKNAKGSMDRVLIWESFSDPDSGINYWSKDRYDVFPKVCVMARGTSQMTTMSDLIAMITPEALSGAADAVQNYDDEGDPDIVDEDDEEAEQDEPEEMDDEDEAEEEAEDDGEPEDDDEEAEEAEEDEADEDEYASRRAELDAMKPLALKAAVEAAGMTVAEFKGKPMDDIVQAILDVEFGDEEPEPEDEGVPEEDDLNLDEMMEEDEPEDEPAPAIVKTAARKPAAKKTTARKVATVTPIKKTAARPVARTRAKV